MRYIKFLVLPLLAMMAVGCHSNHDHSHEEEGAAKTDSAHTEMVILTTDQIKLNGIATGQVGLRNLSNGIVANGVTDVPPQNMFMISSPYGGMVKRMDQLQGSRVNKGQVLVVIENPEFIQLQQDYLENKAQLNYLKLEYERQKMLQEQDVNARKVYEKAKAEYLAMEAKVAAIGARLKMIGISPASVSAANLTSTISVTSPISGYVTEVSIAVGNYVNATQPMLKVVDPEHLHAEITVYEKDLASIHIGQAIRVKLNADTAERTAHVHLVGREVSADKTVRIHGHFDKEDLTLVPGMYLKAVIETNEAEHNAVPDDAVVSYDGRHFVFVLEETDAKGSSHFVMQQVAPGKSAHGYTEIQHADSLKGKTIVVNGAFKLLAAFKNAESEGGHSH
jgi:cobalt-zinc-cadmium efflux system membrane fusion protein